MPHAPAMFARHPVEFRMVPRRAVWRSKCDDPAERSQKMGDDAQGDTLGDYPTIPKLQRFTIINQLLYHLVI
jgi:hypothetical protein